MHIEEWMKLENNTVSETSTHIEIKKSKKSVTHNIQFNLHKIRECTNL